MLNIGKDLYKVKPIRKVLIWLRNIGAATIDQACWEFMSWAALNPAPNLLFCILNCSFG
jgi:hypothetical protein